MLYDRPYMQASWSGARRSWTVTLIIILAMVYVFQACLEAYTRLPIQRWFGLSCDGLAQGWVWQLFTFQFLHATPLPFHLIFNCIGLFFLGRLLEDRLGARAFLKLYFMSGFGGGLLQVLATWGLGQPPALGVVGASAGVMGLLAAYARLFPMQELTVWIIVFPVTLRAHYLMWFSLLISAYGTLIPFSGLAHGAHLGGLLSGMAFVHWRLYETHHRSSWRVFFDWRRHLPHRKRATPVVVMSHPKPSSAPPRRGAGPMVSEDFITREVDPILDKISAQGIHSLTPEERRTLERARERMGTR